MSAAEGPGHVAEVAPGCHLVHGTSTNWVILTEGADVTLVDTGYPGDRRLLEASLRSVGRRPEDVRAVLVTHAHNDHIGSAALYSRAYGTPVLMHEEEVPHARRDFLHQVSIKTVVRNSWRPGVAPWAVRVIRSGGTDKVPVERAGAYSVPGPLDVPGRPVPVHTPGHTLGHSCYHLPQSGVLLTGDALVSAHPTSRMRGPQLLPRMFDHDRASTVASLETIGKVEADILLPGHGPVHRGSARTAAEQAAGRARRR